MMRPPQLAFVDAYGNPDLQTEKDGVSTHYIIAAVIVDRAESENLRVELEKVRAVHFQTGEMKSSTIGQNDDRRLRVLRDLVSVPSWRFFVSSVDKRQLAGGFMYRKSFWKALHGDLFRKLYDAYPVLRIVCDEVGTAEFMESFASYVRRRRMPTLFTSGEIEFVSSKDEILLQVADVVAGSIARAVDEKKLSDVGQAVLDLLTRHSLGINAWPPRPNVASTATSTSDEDALVREQSVRAAALFVDEHAEDDDFARRCQVECLKFLLFHFQYVNPHQYLATQRVMEAMSRAVGAKVTRDTFRLGVIAKLRDAGVVVASSNKGYKIPASVRDLLDFVEHGRAIIEPMLGRLSVARAKMRLASSGALDIVGDHRLDTLRRLIDVVDDVSVRGGAHEVNRAVGLESNR